MLRSAPGAFDVYNLGTDETVVVNDSIAVICEHGLDARAGVLGRQAAVGRRQPADPARLRQDPVAGLDTDTDDSRGDREHLEVVRRQSRTSGGRSGRAGRRTTYERDLQSGPLRISLGGGGTDLPSYYREHGGFLVAGAIDKYIYMLIHTVFQRQYKMKYSETEDVDDVASIKHPILRESLLRHWRAIRSRSRRSPTCRPGPGWGPRVHSRWRC